MSEKEEKEQTPETGNITREEIEKYGQITIYHKEEGERTKANLSVITIIGEIEGHECLSQNTKTTKYFVNLFPGYLIWISPKNIPHL